MHTRLNMTAWPCIALPRLGGEITEMSHTETAATAAKLSPSRLIHIASPAKTAARRSTRQSRHLTHSSRAEIAQAMIRVSGSSA